VQNKDGSVRRGIPIRTIIELLKTSRYLRGHSAGRVTRCFERVDLLRLRFDELTTSGYVLYRHLNLALGCLVRNARSLAFYD
jgi:hypothetical protein